MGRRLSRWRAMTGGQKRRLVLLAMLLPVTALLLRFAGLARTTRLFDRLGGQAPRQAATPEALADAHDLARLARMVGVRSPIDASCLRQSLVVRTWLRRKGLDARMLIGVKKSSGKLDAHAWVELDGEPLAQGDSGHVRFAAEDLGATR